MTETKVKVEEKNNTISKWSTKTLSRVFGKPI